MTTPIARIVWYSGAAEVGIPPEMGIPSPVQLQGSILDQLGELSGRVCYDSLGKGRNSTEYHQHIKDVHHHSVYRHANLTFQFDAWGQDAFGSPVAPGMILGALIGRPGVQLTRFDSGLVRFTCNAQAALEWFTRPVAYTESQEMAKALGALVASYFSSRAPLTLSGTKGYTVGDEQCCPNFRPVVTDTADELYISVFFSGVSRIFSHELVRHTWNCAPSQRSGRYCDENETPWVVHPALVGEEPELCTARNDFLDIEVDCKTAYRSIADKAEKVLTAQGLDKLSARKQAKSAARGVLGNALGTELIFTTNATEWNVIFGQRVSKFADLEICQVMTEVQRQFCQRWPTFFAKN